MNFDDLRGLFSTIVRCSALVSGVACAPVQHADSAPAATPTVSAPSSTSERSRGPTLQQRSWQSVGWGGGGYYWACAFDPTRDGVVYLGGDVNGFYKSTDHGKSWRISNRGLGTYAIYSMAVDASRAGTVYVATTGGLYVSRDFGDSWDFIEDSKRLNISAERGKSVRALAIGPSGAVTAGTPKGGLFRSEDGGKSWRALRVSAKAVPIHSVAASASDPKLLLIASDAGIARSDDGGNGWTRSKGPAFANSIAIAPNSDRTMYAACGKAGVWRSVDRGVSWKQLEGIDAKYEALDVVIHPSNPDSIALIARAGWAGAFYSSDDGGKHWSESHSLVLDHVNDPTLPYEGAAMPFSAVSNLARNPLRPEEFFIAANWRNPFSSNGGKSWEERDRGADITVATDIRFSGTQTYVTAMDEGLLVSPDQGASWKQLLPKRYTAGLSGHAWRVAVLPRADHAPRVVATSSPWDKPINQVVVSDDGGASFAEITAGLPDHRPKHDTVWGEGYARALAVDPSAPNRLYLGIDGEPEQGFEGGGAFVSDDAGSSWRRLSGQPDSRRVFYGIAVDPTDTRTLFWGATGDKGGIYRSRDLGATWQRLPFSETWVFNLAVSARGVVYGAGSNAWKSTDRGNTWKKLTAFSDGLAIVGLEIDPRHEETLWLSRVSWGEDAHGGVYESTDGGTTWSEITFDLPHVKPLVLRYNPSTSELWAGGVGLYKLNR